MPKPPNRTSAKPKAKRRASAPGRARRKTRAAPVDPCSCERRWVYADAPERGEIDAHHVGKWLIWARCRQVPTSWAAVRAGTEEGALGISAKDPPPITIRSNPSISGADNSLGRKRVPGKGAGKAGGHSRSAKTGRYVSDDYAKKYPSTTVTEHDKPKKK